MAEPRTIRELRLAIREAEAALERIHMSPAMALVRFRVEFSLHDARLALRRAERAAAQADDPRLDHLPPLRPQVKDRAPQTRPRRRRYRCPVCFHESLRAPGESVECYRRRCDGEVEPVARLAGTKRTTGGTP